MNIDIDGMSEAELLDLNHRVVARLRLLQQVRTHQTMLGFSLGERVWFQPEGPARRHGVVTRYNKKTITVVTDAGEHWKVSPTALHKDQGSNKASVSGNVIPLRRK
jgi:hypothetical protein